MKYYVVSKFFDNGKVQAEILLESEKTEDIKSEMKENYDQYVDTFDSYEEAEKFKKECFLA
jgi:hypothetical protein